jgi:hypothetical protein
VEIAKGFSEQRSRLDIGKPQIDPSSKFIDQWCTVALASLKALLDTLAKAFGLGINVEDL